MNPHYLRCAGMCHAFFMIIFVFCSATAEHYSKAESSEQFHSGKVLVTDERNANRIQPYSANPAYWQYRGEPVLLIGGTSNDNLFQTENVEAELDRLVENGGNYVRNTMSSRDEGNEYPFFFDEEIHFYDLNHWNPTYWEKFENFLKAAHEREIIVQIEIWATYDFYSRPGHVLDGQTAWERNPFNPKNNINYTERNSGLYERFRSTHGTLVNPFFHTVLPLPEPFDFDLTPVVLGYQQQFVDKVLSVSLEYDHVLYVIDNETNADPKWPRYWSQYIRQKAADMNREIEVTEMWDTFDPTDGAVEGVLVQNPATHFFTRRASVANTLYDPENYSYLDISNHNAQRGEMHYKTGLYVWNEVQKSGVIRPINNTKIYGADGGWAGDYRHGLERFWRNVFAGHASVRFHRPPSGLGHTDLAMSHIKSMRELSEAIDITKVHPANELLNNRNENEAYCLADPGNIYAVVFLNGGKVQLDVSDLPAGDFMLKWLNVADSEWSEGTATRAGGNLELNTPEESGFWVAVVSGNR
jgi:hypothetical protein